MTFNMAGEEKRSWLAKISWDPREDQNMYLL